MRKKWISFLGVVCMLCLHAIPSSAEQLFRYDSVNMPAMMAVSIKQIYGYVCWAALFLTSAFLLLDIPRVRTGLHKLPYWPVYAIQYLTRKR